jgi:hypothetical protein
MSYINIHKVDLEEGASDEAQYVPEIHEGNEIYSFTDGEEIDAASRLVGDLGDLSEGEALVVWKNIF